ncbi:MAG: hypothetical protein QM647_14160 [Asticcacaulis sp.]|uniref:hypothetical protein n=1 Tax=Asticcacaulis sp. TaxID=1872648 RepID=UPI0039E5BFBC
MHLRNLIPAFPLAVAAAFALSGALSGTAQAAGTVAGTNINNTATVNYSVGGATQTPVTSNTATFVVDRKVNLSVTEVGGATTTISYGSTNQVTTFQVTNLTNATQDFRLVASQQLSLALTLLGLTDNMDMSNVRVFVDANNNGTYEAATDTATYIDELAPDTSKTVFIVADAPASGAANGTAGVGLTAISAAGGTAGTLGSDLVATVGADNPATVDIVFADATAGPLDAAYDGKQSALDAYAVASTTVTFAKTATIISDPVNLTTTPKAIPGATVEYCLRVSNTGLNAATGLTITDAIPANTTYVANSLYVGGSVVSTLCLADGTHYNDTGAAGSGATMGGTADGTNVTAYIPTLAAGVTTTARFRVTLN